MQISEINILTPIEVIINDGDSKKKLFVFYNNDSGSVHSLNDLDDELKSLIKDGIKKQLDDEMDDFNFLMPEYVLETMDHADNENHEFFGLTKEMKENKFQETENKEGENV